MPRFHRKIIKISATSSPNVALALAQKAAGQEPTGEVLIPGVLPWKDYCYRLATWDAIRISIGLNAEFYEGAETRLYPPAWLHRSQQFAESLVGRVRTVKVIGVDPAEGGDKTSMAAVDELGVVELLSQATPDTSKIPGMVLNFAARHKVSADRIIFDRGGGGKQITDYLRSIGHRVRSVAFGEGVTREPKKTPIRFNERRDLQEERSAYKNRRAEMYGTLRLLLDPVGSGVNGIGGARGWGIPAQYRELLRQLAPIPLLYDGEGKLELPPKNRRGTVKHQERATLYDLIGCSPDEADACVLAIFGMLNEGSKSFAGAFFNRNN